MDSRPHRTQTVVGADRFFNLALDLLLSPIRGRDKAIQAGEFAQETDEAHTARSDLDADQVQGQNEPMQAGKSRATLKELGHMGTDVQGVIPLPPGLQRGSRNLERFGRLTL